MNFTIYKSDTGEVLSSGTADEPEALLGPGQSLHLGDIYGEGYFVAGVHHALPAQPSAVHRFDYASKQWVDPRSLADLKAAKNEAINAARLRANQSHFVYQGKNIATDPLSRSDIDGAHGSILMLQAMPPGWPGGWKAMDNSFIAIATVPEWIQFYAAMVTTGTANFNRAQALKAQLAAATTAAQVEDVPNW